MRSRSAGIWAQHWRNIYRYLKVLKDLLTSRYYREQEIFLWGFQLLYQKADCSTMLYTFEVANCDIKVNNTKSTDSGAIYILKGYLRHYTRKSTRYY